MHTFARGPGIVATTIAALVITSGTPASAATVSEPIATGFAGPLSIAVAADRSVYVGQSFAGLLTKVAPDGSRIDLVAEPGASVEGLSIRRGKVTYTTTVGGEAGITSSLVKRLAPSGRVTTVADTLAFERANNPDGGITYGFRHLSADCRAQFPPAFPPEFITYTGNVDSHAYATAVGSDGTTYVADAGSNTILAVSPSGTPRTVAVVPPVPYVVTADGAAVDGLPACTVGETYFFESVPTDVEIGSNGLLYVSLLPGGPEDPSLGARGQVVTVNPNTGNVRTIARGFAGATNVAVTRKGVVYVAELFGGQVSRIRNGGPVTVASMPTPAAVEWRHQKIYVAYDVFGPGALATITP